MTPSLLPDVTGAFIAATATGFLGSLHCIGMCGTTAASIISRVPVSVPRDKGSPIPLVQFSVAGTGSAAAGNWAAMSTTNASARNSLAFNAGRIASYMIAGTLVAGIAGTIAGQVIMQDIMPIRLALFIVGQCLVIATGFYIAGYTKPMAPFERIGRVLWQFLQRFVAPRLLKNRLRGQGDLFLLGALWGWIPCGMVYGTLATAMAAGSAPGGALIMLGFGLGTLPAMFAAGAAAAPLRKLAQQQTIRIAAGAVVVALGLYGLSRSGTQADFAALGAFCSSAVATIFSGAAP